MLRHATLFLLLYYLLMCNSALALPGQAHVKDVADLLQTNEFNRVAKFVSQGIDVEFPAMLRIMFPYVTRPGPHRLHGHWGFSGDIPFKHEPWKSTLSQYPKSDYINCWKAFRERIIARVMNETGFSYRKAEGLAGILYDIHILGDYTTSDTRGLLSVDNLIKDLKKHIEYYLGKEHPKAIKACQELDGLRNGPSDSDTMQKARKVVQQNTIVDESRSSIQMEDKDNFVSKRAKWAGAVISVLMIAMDVYSVAEATSQWKQNNITTPHFAMTSGLYASSAIIEGAFLLSSLNIVEGGAILGGPIGVGIGVAVAFAAYGVDEYYSAKYRAEEQMLDLLKRDEQIKLIKENIIRDTVNTDFTYFAAP